MLFVTLLFFFKSTATTEIYTYYTLFPYTTLFRSTTPDAIRRARHSRQAGPDRHPAGQWRFANASPAAPETAVRYRSEEHTSELQSLMRISYAVFCLNKKTNIQEK